MSSRRLSPKEIKHDIREDEVHTFLVRTLDHLQDNPKQVMGVAGGLLALVLIIAGVTSYLDHQKTTANEKLADALAIYQAPIDEESPKPDDPREPSFASEDDRQARAKAAFETVRDGFGSDIAGEVAGLYLADIAASGGDTETARATWERFLDHHDDHILAVSVRLNLIRYDRTHGQAEAVAQTLETELLDPAKKLPEDVILFELGQTREALGQDEEALEAYQRIIDEHPQSPYVARARQLTTSAG